MSKNPPFLQKGDLIVVVSPSGVVDRELVVEGTKALKEAGYKVEIAENALNGHFKFGATPAQRLSDLQYALNHPVAKAIYCARGGFGVTQIIDELSWEHFIRNPKWIIGFSDITALLHATYQNGFSSLHASVLQGIPKLPEWLKEYILTALAGSFRSLKAESSFHKIGTSKSDLIGGNLSLLVHQLGTASEVDYSGKILFIEEVAEPLYHIDRMMLQLKRSGKLRNLAGLVVGQFSGLTEDKLLYGQSLEEIILAHCKDYDFPIGFNFPFGHGEENEPLIHGAAVLLTVMDEKSTLEFLP